MAPDLVAEFVTAFNEEINRGRREQERRRETLLREEKNLERRIDNLLDAVASGELRGSAVQAKLDAFEERKREVAKQCAALADEPTRLHPGLAGVYRQKVALLHSLLRQEGTRTEAVEIIRSLIDQVILRPSAEGGLEIELVGDLARMIEIALDDGGAGRKKTALPEGLRRSVKMVAGAGFEPATFRL